MAHFHFTLIKLTVALALLASESRAVPSATRPAETRPATRPVIEYAEPGPPPAPLGIGVELEHDTVYPGEPIAITVYLASPAAEAATRPANTLLDAVSAEWASNVHFAMFQETDGQLRPAGAALDWAKLRLADRVKIRGNLLADWEIPASASLPTGDYVLRVTWEPPKTIDAKLLDGAELTGELRFCVTAPENDQQKAEHLERMALLAYREKRFADTRRLAEEAIKADRQSTSPQRVRMLLVQAGACLAMDDFKAGLEVYRSLLKLPLDENLATDLKAKIKILEKLTAKPSKPK